MKTLLTLLLLAASAFAQTATISDTIRTPFGGTFSGTVTVSLNSPALAQPLYSGSVTLSGWTQAVTVTAGVFTLTLYTNDLITPGGTSYTATYAPTSGSGWKETWIVPTGATTIREIRSTTVPSPSVRFTPSQITQAGATLGQGLKWDGSKWAPADVVANPMTTNGDLITRLGGVPVRVGIGSTNQVLTVSGGMPVWASGITGNASTASALAANGTNCTAGSYPLGVDASGNAEGCTAAVTASTGLSDSAALVRNNQANTYTAGNKQTFASNATTAGAAFGGGITADPSSVSAGDFWYRTDLGTFGFRNATAVDALVAGGRALSTVGSVPFVTSSGVLGQSANLFWDNANARLGVGTNAPSQRVQIASGNVFISTVGQSLYLGGITDSGTDGMRLFNNGSLSYIDTKGGGLVIRSDATFGSTERARFAATTGNLLLGTTTDGNFRLDVASSGSSGTTRIYDQTPTTGSTSLVVRAGAGQGTNSLMRWQNASGVTLGELAMSGSNGSLNWLGTTGVVKFGMYADGASNGLFISSDAGISWKASTDNSGAPEMSFRRDSSTQIGVYSSPSGSYRDLALRAIRAVGVTVANLPSASGNAGMMATVTDANAITIGTTVAGGGANTVLVWSNGTNWRIYAN